MGSIFTNVQVRVGSRGVAATRDAVVATLRAEARAAGYIEVAEGEPADRSVLVYARKRSTWITVYDEAAEAQEERVEHLAATLAGALGDWAVSVLVHDDSALHLSAYASGQRVDAFDPAREPNPERWRPLLRDDAAVDSLRACWSTRPAFAVSTLRTTARLVSFSADACTTGFRYMTEDTGGRAASGASLIRLAFRADQTPAWQRRASGPPRFDFHGSSLMVRGSAGGPSHAQASVVNRGGAARGLRVAVWGDALDQGLVAIERVDVLVGDFKRRGPITATPRKATYQGDKHLSVIDLDDVELGAGVAPKPKPEDMTDWHHWMEAEQSAVIHANLSLRALAVGTGRLVIGFVPKDDEQGQFGTALPVTITAAGQPLAPVPFPEASAAPTSARHEVTLPGKKIAPRMRKKGPARPKE